MANHSLSQHSAQASPEWMHMRCAVLFKSNQPAEASAQTLEWIRSGHSLPHSAAADAIALLCQHQAYQSALTAVNVLSERLVASFDSVGGANHVPDQGSEASIQFSELQEVHRPPPRATSGAPAPGTPHSCARLTSPCHERLGFACRRFHPASPSVIALRSASTSC